jgi:cell division septation protein DedD
MMTFRAVSVYSLSVLILLGATWSAPALPQNDTTPLSKDMTQLQADYENALKKFDDDQVKALTKLVAGYTNALAILEKKAEESDDRRSFLLIRKARDMFNVDKCLRESDIASAGFPELTKLQKDYLRAFTQCPLTKAKGVLNLARQFDKSLEALQSELTKKGDTDTAIKVRTYRESLKDRPEIVQANALITQGSAAPSATVEAEPATHEDTPPTAQKPAESKTQEDAHPTTATQKVAEPKSSPPAVSNKTEKAETGGHTKKRPESFVEQRFTKLYQAIQAGDNETAREFVDPTYLKNEGPGAVDHQLGFIFGFVQVMKRSGTVRVAPKEIKIDDKSQTATLVPKLWYANKWNEEISMFWMRINGEWYVDIYTDIKKGPKTRQFHIITGDVAWSMGMSR